MASVAVGRFAGRPSDPNTGILQIPGPPNGQYCCQGHPDLSLENLDFYQTIPHGTGAHKDSYSRRNQVENVIGMLGDKEGLDEGSCRAFGLAPHTITAIALVTAHNIRLTERAEFVRNMFPGADQEMGTENSLTAGEQLLDPAVLSNPDRTEETNRDLLDPEELITPKFDTEEDEEEQPSAESGNDKDNPPTDSTPPNTPEPEPTPGHPDTTRPPQTRQNSPP